VKITEPQMEAASTAAPVEADQQTLYRDALQEVVTKLDIRGTFPKRKQVLVGAQNLSVGD
jgi:hypothetical protein